MPDITSFQGEYRWLSNFWACPFKHEGFLFPTAEHAFQLAKCTNPQDAQKIANAPTPGQAKKLARRVPLRPDWDRVKLPIMFSIVHSKFKVPELRDKLIATGDAMLIGGNTWNDKYWGQSPLGTGENYLGRILMAVRDEARGIDRGGEALASL